MAVKFVAESVVLCLMSSFILVPVRGPVLVLLAVVLVILKSHVRMSVATAVVKLVFWSVVVLCDFACAASAST